MTEELEHQSGRYSQAHPQGGIALNDESNLISNVFKDIMKKIGSSLIKGQFSNVLKIGTPAYTHSHKTYHDIIKCEFELIEETLCLM